ncbi:signal peptidase I [Chlamydia ibidis]|uniref:Signal peptidase I n=2 Tax=Chlamydia ibidis TaxID=1405396 RepID=S7J3T0_9CHLA|nr:signal peptidase I [Chlamydia ibidis]EPP35079.1 signal peptidase I [Chlamydia ibidis]EQM62629.1 signal peptidase I [Chlamydia ibidis 10-1398/6]
MRHPLSLNKSRQILRSSFKLFKSKKLSKLPDTHVRLGKLLEQLEDAIFQQDQELASSLAEEVQQISRGIPLTFSDRALEVIKALLFAATIAFVIRQFWFELYEVPTGSMRPTILEQDRILVSKTTFGLHIPFKEQPWGFNPKSITRGGLVVFTVGNLPIPDSDTKYFGFIPGKKRYIKRCIGKPGDTLYFYGGKIYGVDKDDKPIQFPTEYGLNELYHVPYISFDGSTEITSHENTAEVYFKQMYQPCGKISLPQTSYGQFFHKNSWTDDTPDKLKEPHTTPVSYADLFGIGNYAMVRILTHKQALLLHHIIEQPSSAYLEICHTPNVSYPKPTIHRYGQTLIPAIRPMTALLPLRKEHIHLIRNNLTTSRFVVEDGLAYKYHPFSARQSHSSKIFALSFPDIPNGCYEYCKGQAYKIGFGGIRHKLKSSHPLMQLTDTKVIELFNCGINFNSIFSPNNPKQSPLPNRYAFYNQGNLYIMNAPVFIKNDPSLQKFTELEKHRQSASRNAEPYIAFIDRPILPDLEQDFIEFVKNFGIRVPEDHVLVLGDNYAMSADSREFGFVPVKNLLGAPLWTFWPFGHFNHLASVPAPTTFPGYLVNGIAICLFLGLIGRCYYQRKRRFFRKYN